MDDESESAEAAPPYGERPHVWGIWKRQVIDVGGDRRAAEILEEHSGLIRLFMRRAPLPRNGVFSEDDLFGVYQAALLQAYSCYDPAKAAFSTWAMTWLRQAYLDIARRARGLSRREQDLYRKKRARERWDGADPSRRNPAAEPPALTEDDRADLVRAFGRRVLSMHDNVGHATGDGRPLEETLGTEDDPAAILERQKREWLFKKLGNGILSPRERDVMERFLDGWTTIAIADEHRCSRQYIEAIRKEAIRKLRIAAVKDGFAEDED